MRGASAEARRERRRRARSPWEAFGLALVGSISLASPVAAGTVGCKDLVPTETPFPARELETEDLARLRDIGPSDPSQQDSGLFSVSPDGKRAAFQLRRGNPATNSYCLAMLVVDLKRGAQPTIVDRGGDFMRMRIGFRGKFDMPSGFTDVITPRWSPDGRWIFFRKKDGGAVQLWRARTDGRGSRAITSGADDIDDFRVSADGKTIILATRPSVREGRAAIDREALSGFHYDDRSAPATSDRPFLEQMGPVVALALDVGTFGIRPATSAETALLDLSSMQEGRWNEAYAGSVKVGIQPKVGSYHTERGQLSVTTAETSTRCEAAACVDAKHPWWINGKVRFLRSEGSNDEVTAIYEWVPGERGPRRIYATEDLFLGCVPDGAELICLREGALQPRRLERLNPVTGQRTVVFDPNPEFAGLTLGRVERLRYRNSFGLDSFADLVLPVGYKPGTRYPLIVVQYRSRGFLRGGTGDDYPIQAFANRGFAVLSFDRPRSVAWDGSADFAAISRKELENFADRRSVLESVEAPVRAVIARGIADPKRIGMTGMSDGSSTATFAMLNSTLFSAFAVSHCCWDTNLAMRVGPSSAREFYAMGYPKITDESQAARKFWGEIAISLNAKKIRAPILAQISDTEYLSALQSYTALKELSRPIDLFVFPDEYHAKWQPAHRLAIYLRSIDWFDYWLNEKRDFGPSRIAEVMHWDELRKSSE